MKKIFGNWKILVALAIAVMFTLSFSVPDDVFARSGGSSGGSRGGGGGFKSSSPSKSWGTSKPSAPSKSWGTSKPSAPSASPATKPSDKKFGTTPGDSSKAAAATSVNQSSKPTTSKADKALYNKAKQNGTAFKTRDAAAQDFKQKHAAKYTSKYSSEPSTRPTHIPQTYSAGGTTYNVVYNPGLGGYGYFNAMLGTWILYDMMTDMAMANAMMHQHGYYVGDAPARGFGLVWFVLIVLAVVAVATAIMVFARRR